MSFQQRSALSAMAEKKSTHLFSLDGGAEIGPLLAETIELQHRDEVATSYPAVESYAARLASLCETHGNPLVWPVGAAAERLAGAAALVGKGRVRVRGWSDDVAGERILILCTAVATPLGLRAAATQARALGAKAVDGCAIELSGVDHDALADVLDSYSSLEAGSSGVSRPRARMHQRRVTMA